MIYSFKCYTEVRMDKRRVTAIGVPVRRFLVSRGVIQITRISDERTQAK